MLTIPNALTLLRLLGVPLFVYLTLSLKADEWAILVLTIAGATDYFDGKLARAWGQTSRLGEIADPAIDRLYICAILVVFLIREVVPIWLIAVLLLRDLILALLSVILRARGLALLQVTFLGKAATFNLMYAFPFLLLATIESVLGTIASVVGWAFAIWGVGLYLVTGAYYAREAFYKIRSGNVINT